MLKKIFLISLLTATHLPVYSAEKILIPQVPTAKEIDQAVLPPKANCEQCQENSIIDKLRADVSKLKTKYECKSGRKRLKEDKTFYIAAENNSGSANTIMGNFQPGSFMTGQISQFYSGVSAFNDLMVVTEVKDNKRILGYNVTLSMCEMPNAYPQFPAIISDKRDLTHFQAPYGITLGHDTTCGMGVVELAMNTGVISQKSTQQLETTAAPIYTSFVRVNCN